MRLRSDFLRRITSHRKKELAVKKVEETIKFRHFSCVFD